jgi:hypothetical protein
MTCIEAIREAITALPENALISSRDLVKYGLRNTVDQAIYRLIKTNFITRVARGVFIKSGAAWPSAFAVALCKAKAFGKNLVTHGQTIAQELKLLPEQEDCRPPSAENEVESQLIFQIRGRSSSFVFAKRKIYLRGASDRVVHLGESPIGRLIRALWYIGRKVGDRHLAEAISRIGHQALHLIIEQTAWMPAWLSNKVRLARDMTAKLPSGA